MPDLAKVLIFEKRMEEFHDISLPFTSFINKNLKSRQILMIAFNTKSII